MTKDEFVEHLSQTLYDYENEGHGTWRDTSEKTRISYRAIVVSEFLPLFVNFVDDWLLSYWPAGSSDTDDMAERWREEMH